MDKVSVKLEVLFQEPFWIGLCERQEDGRLFACRRVYGSEPKDYEVFEDVLKNWQHLKFSPPVAVKRKSDSAINPKRRQRLVQKELLKQGIGTKSQQALKLLQEANKTERKILSREEREREKERLFALKQQKKKEKQRGR